MKIEEVAVRFLNDPTPFQRGIPDEAQAPHCRDCGKVLRYNTRVRQFHRDDFGDEVPFPIDKIVRIHLMTPHPGLSTTHLAFELWVGTFGFDGTGYFCSESCAYQWAVTVLRERV